MHVDDQPIAYRDDATAPAPGAIKHLLQHLWDAYLAHLDDRIRERTKEGKASRPLGQAARAAPARSFLEFAAAYLAEQRVVESFPLDFNLGVRLADNTLLSLCPPADVAGTMQGGVSVAITEGRTHDAHAPKIDLDPGRGLQI